MKGVEAERIIEWAFGLFGEKIAFASSLGAEDQVLTRMIMEANPSAVIFTLDTGRLPQETYDLMSLTMARYGFKYRILFPRTEAVEELYKDGSNLFYDSIEQRKKCCHVRKMEPLARALQGLEAWICGLRRAQSVTRSGIFEVEWDENNRLVKINPLAGWPEELVWTYIREHRIPYNKLHDLGYPSLGCAPCTRAVKPGEDIRSGRWWWESPEQKECGLHAGRYQEKAPL